MTVKKLTSTMEDYLETILVLKKRRAKVARVRDIAALLDVKSPTVNAAIKTLAVSGYVIHEKYGYVDLTAKGEEIARSIQRKHNVLTEFLVQVLDVDKQTAEQDACSMEHAISAKTSARLAKFIEFIGYDMCGYYPRWLKSFRLYMKTGKKLKCVLCDEEPKVVKNRSK